MSEPNKKFSPEELKERYASIAAKVASKPKVTDPNLVPFGKYRGKSIEALLADEGNYCEWLLKQPWFSKKCPELYARVLEAKPIDSPATRLAALCAQIREIYGAASEVLDLTPFRRDLDIVRRHRAILEAVPANATEAEQQAALDRIDQIV